MTPSPSSLGSNVTLSATVAADSGTPSGSVQFYDGTAPIGSEQTVGTDGVATLTVSTLALGSHTIAAMFTPNSGSNFEPSTGTQDGQHLVGVSPSITSDPTTTFTVTNAGTFTVHTSGSPSASLSESGSLPGGVTFTGNGDGTATIAGTPPLGSTGATPSRSRHRTALRPMRCKPSPWWWRRLLRP